jgi:hypothetical protein
LTAVHAGMAKSPSKLDLPLDSGPLRFRRKLQQMIQAEQAAAEALSSHAKASAALQEA